MGFKIKWIPHGYNQVYQRMMDPDHRTKQWVFQEATNRIIGDCNRGYKQNIELCICMYTSISNIIGDIEYRIKYKRTCAHKGIHNPQCDIWVCAIIGMPTEQQHKVELMINHWNWGLSSQTCWLFGVHPKICVQIYYTPNITRMFPNITGIFLDL